ncbi:outer membrane protein [Halobacteroides halobius DSM 5150]|uniref:Outer membrane protein n=1 Tax=Halobacteroides halobius (strain ATCC 35273 / DSM 5150 / MD-1) TaxID=748449 RepID=L0KD82_HALHC|nr:OmpH family outer membrane protein [Halobacteroides halobius]AGB42314.1 outer membrane protein [Halobacteroides halobius DSM 5150]
MSQKIIKISLLGILVLGLLVGCAQQDTKPKVKIKTKIEKLKVAVVNKDKIWTKSKSAQEYQKKLNQEIKQLQQNYQKESKDLNQGEKVKKQQKLYLKINDLRAKLRDQFKNKIKQAIKEIAQEKDYDIVLDQTEVKYGGTNITDKVIKKLDSEK